MKKNSFYIKLLKKKLLFICAVSIMNFCLTYSINRITKQGTEFEILQLYNSGESLYVFGIVAVEYLYFILKFLDYYKINVIIRIQSNIQLLIILFCDLLLQSFFFCFVQHMAYLIFALSYINVFDISFAVIVKTFLLQFASFFVIGQGMLVLFLRGIPKINSAVIILSLYFIMMTRNRTFLDYFLLSNLEITNGTIEKIIFTNLALALIIISSKRRDNLVEE